MISSYFLVHITNDEVCYDLLKNKKNESWEVYLPVIRINAVKRAKACHDRPN